MSPAYQALPLALLLLAATSCWQARGAEQGTCAAGLLGDDGACTPDSLGRTAFLVDQGNAVVVICSLVDGKFKDCQASDGSAGGASPLVTPAGVAVVGETVWVTGSTVPAKVHICQGGGHKLTSCKVSSMDGEHKRAEGIAIDTAHNFAYVAAQLDNCIIQCSDPAAMAGCSCVALPRPMATPIGLSLAAGHLWIGLDKGVARCPVGAKGLDTEHCAYTDLNERAKISPSGVLALLDGDDEAGRVLVSDMEAGKVWSCQPARLAPAGFDPDVALGTCRDSYGDSLLAGKDGSNFPGVVGMALSEGRLLVPLFYGGSVIACDNAKEVSGCKPLFPEPMLLEHIASLAVV